MLKGKTARTFMLLMCCIVYVLFVGACGSQGGQESPSPSPSPSNLSKGGPGTLVKSYGTLAELAKDASEIVEIQVTSQETINYADMPFTISTVTVLKSFKGGHQEGDTMRIIETGGEFTPLDKQGDPLPTTTMKFNGIPVMQMDEHSVIFLNGFEGPQVTGEVYVPLGVYQGRFIVFAEGNVVQQAPDEEKVKDLQEMKIDPFAETLQKLLDLS